MSQSRVNDLQQLGSTTPSVQYIYVTYSLMVYEMRRELLGWFLCAMLFSGLMSMFLNSAVRSRRYLQQLTVSDCTVWGALFCFVVVFLIFLPLQIGSWMRRVGKMEGTVIMFGYNITLGRACSKKCKYLSGFLTHQFCLTYWSMVTAKTVFIQKLIVTIEKQYCFSAHQCVFSISSSLGNSLWKCCFPSPPRLSKNLTTQIKKYYEQSKKKKKKNRMRCVLKLLW